MKVEAKFSRKKGFLRFCRTRQPYPATLAALYCKRELTQHRRLAIRSLGIAKRDCQKKEWYFAEGLYCEQGIDAGLKVPWGLKKGIAKKGWQKKEWYFYELLYCEQWIDAGLNVDEAFMVVRQSCPLGIADLLFVCGRWKLTFQMSRLFYLSLKLRAEWHI